MEPIRPPATERNLKRPVRLIAAPVARPASALPTTAGTRWVPALAADASEVT